MAFDRHARVPADQQQAAEDHRLAHAQPAVGEHAADHRQAVHQPAVCAQDVVAGLVAEAVVLQQVQQQQRLHSVEGEALPHLGEEADVDALGMAEQFVAQVALDGQVGRHRRSRPWASRGRWSVARRRDPRRSQCQRPGERGDRDLPCLARERPSPLAGSAGLQYFARLPTGSDPWPARRRLPNPAPS